MKYFETKYEKDSAKITALIAVILLLLIFIAGPKYMDPPLEYGIAVNFGSTDFGSGRVQPKKPVRAQPKEIKQPQKIEESKPETSKPQETKEDVLTQDNAESIAIKKREDAEKKKKAEAEAKAKKEAERIERIKREQDAKKKRLDDLIGGIGKSDGTETGGEGDDNRAGDKGQLNGDPYAPSYSGQPGSGGGGTGYGLGNRGKLESSKFKPECEEEGIVVVEIHVNRQGRVMKAIPGKKGTTGVTCLFEAARKTAFSYKWKPDSNAPERQIGFVVVNFSLSQ
ncbi:putative TonB-dependent receptor [hydrothermal vent metagenome]|uniref:Putative TonB-dependent receptor n=1 Tax=hydrothermal vent metagenome TaxID=652676 RepID=A0A3B0QU88_9ZZZZ